MITDFKAALSKLTASRYNTIKQLFMVFLRTIKLKKNRVSFQNLVKAMTPAIFQTDASEETEFKAYTLIIKFLITNAKEIFDIDDTTYATIDKLHSIDENDETPSNIDTLISPRLFNTFPPEKNNND